MVDVEGKEADSLKACAAAAVASHLTNEKEVKRLNQSRKCVEKPT